jgi:hypothetical protein
LTGAGVITASTKYYLDIIRDDDAGANNTGQYIVYICTGNYKDETGFNLIDTLTRDCSVGEKNDFRYLSVCAGRQRSGTATTSGLIENHEDQNASDIVDAAATITGVGSVTASAEVIVVETIDAAATITGIGSVTAYATSNIRASNRYTRLIAIGYNQLYYEDI